MAWSVSYYVPIVSLVRPCPYRTTAPVANALRVHHRMRYKQGQADTLKVPSRCKFVYSAKKINHSAQHEITTDYGLSPALMPLGGASASLQSCSVLKSQELYLNVMPSNLCGFWRWQIPGKTGGGAASAQRLCECTGVGPPIAHPHLHGRGGRAGSYLEHGQHRRHAGQQPWCRSLPFPRPDYSKSRA